jgi:4-hydroxyproline epimerase
VIFFNNVGYLGMCGHGTIGVVATLAHLGRIQPGEHRIETPVGPVTAILSESGEVTVVNVPAYRYAANVEIESDGYGVMHGDVAWGGNWYFLVEDHGQSIKYANVGKLTDCAWKIRHALERGGITGEGEKQIDHIELFGPSQHADSRNFVLCPGGAYDRSPCGTGTSAKVACLAAAGKLREGEEWRQESIVGTIFRARYRRDGDAIIPSVTGTAYVNAEATLLLDSRDPFELGIRR